MIRQITPDDYEFIISNLNEWWGGRNMSDMLPKLFFKYFNETSFIACEQNEVLGFLIGFIAPSDAAKSYVHFIGVNPAYRNKNIGRSLYEHFFKAVKAKGVKIVECVTSDKNSNSIKFHQQIGFTIVQGDAISENGISYFRDYDGKDEHRVLFQRLI